jgi:nitrite reductase/ring-hydroxylating ferredoxin subunit
MTRRGLARFVDALLGNRRPKPFTAEPDDVDAMRAAIELRGAQPGAGLPRSEFVAELHRRLAEELAESTMAEVEVDTGGRRLSRRRVLTGTAAAAAAAVLGAVVDHEVVTSPSRPAAQKELMADSGAWIPVATSADVAAGQVVPFTTNSVAGFVSRSGERLQAVSGTCTHQGCLLAVDQAAKRLNCPCHRASFATTGEVISHELPQPLPPLPTLPARDHDGRIEVYLPPQV